MRRQIDGIERLSTSKSFTAHGCIIFSWSFFAALLRLRAPVALRIGTNTTANSLKNLDNHTESFKAAENIYLLFFW
jgi:hypothetical protein